jgi:hypothetical protein
MPANVSISTHPQYDALQLDWYKYRLTYEGGRPFIERYLKQFSSRENATDFELRKEMSYCPAHAKAAINDIKNALFQRAVDIKRQGGPLNFLMAADGTDTAGVDNQGNSMNSFIGRILLPELLTMAKVGVWVDKPNEIPTTRGQQMALRPYLYMYRTEDIRNWAFDENYKLVALILQDHTFAYDENNLPTGEVIRYRFARIVDNKVIVTFYDNSGAQIDIDGDLSDTEYPLALTEIPFVQFELTSSLLTDVADYQIALLNVASSDLSYTLRSNFPFYTEQFDPNLEYQHLLRGQQTLEEVTPGTASEAGIAKTTEARVSPSQGRRYPKGMERPGFINPSSEPLRVSMDKQDQLEQEIRRLVNLNVSNIKPSRSSMESKAFDERGLESGLSYIALELEYGERKIAKLWADYEHSTEVTYIKYPERYSIKSDDDRNKEADSIEKSVTMSPSLAYKKQAYKEAVTVRIGHKLTSEDLEEIYKEIDSAKNIVLNDDILVADMENGILSPETAAEIRGYGREEAIKAAAAHEKRLMRIAISQAEGKGMAAARGIADAGDSDEGSEEREDSMDTDHDMIPTDKTRGKAKETT